MPVKSAEENFRNVSNANASIINPGFGYSPLICICVPGCVPAHGCVNTHSPGCDRISLRVRQ